MNRIAPCLFGSMRLAACCATRKPPKALTAIAFAPSAGTGAKLSYTDNTGIVGPGKIMGNHALGGRPTAQNPLRHPALIEPIGCNNIRFEDFSTDYYLMWSLHPTYCENIFIKGLTIRSTGGNGDGIDIDCCRNVRVSNCSVNSPWDDGICLKSSFGLGYARATENVAITNCLVSGYEEGSLLDGTFKRTLARPNFQPTGRIKFGTESNGGFKNITVSNCVFDFCRGLALESVDGGLLEDVTITNITMREVSNSPIFMRLGSRMRGPEGVPVGVMRRVILSNIVCSNAAPGLGSIISGIPGHEIEDVRLNDIYIQHQGGAKDNAAVQPAEDEAKYPEPTMFGLAMPSYGFFIRHAKNIHLSNIELAYDKEDLRPAFVLQEVKGADFFRIRTKRSANARTFVLKKVSDFTVAQSRPLADAQFDQAEEKEI